MTSIRILHISDTHFGRHDADKIAAVVDFAENWKPDIVAITGDLLDLPTGLGFGRTRLQFANDFLLRMRQICPHVFCVPGNHDALLGTSSLSGSWRKLALQKKFVSHFRIRTQGVCVIGVDTTSFYLRHLNNSGAFDKAQHAWLQKELEKLRKRSDVNLNDSINIALAHHHPIPTNASNAEQMLYFRDSGRFIKFSSDNNVRLILHGHQHDPNFTRISFGSDYDEDVIGILSAGSCAKLDSDTSERSGCGQFYGIEIDSDKAMISSYYHHRNDGRFVATDQFRISRALKKEPRLITAKQELVAKSNGDLQAVEQRTYARLDGKETAVLFCLGVDDESQGCKISDLNLNVTGGDPANAHEFAQDGERQKILRVPIQAGQAGERFTVTVKYSWPRALARLLKPDGSETGELTIRSRGLEWFNVQVTIEDPTLQLDDLRVYYGNTKDVEYQHDEIKNMRGFVITKPRSNGIISWAARVKTAPPQV